MSFHEIIPAMIIVEIETREVIQRLADARLIIKLVFSATAKWGRAIADGHRVAYRQIRAVTDCDFQHPLPEIRDLGFDAAQRDTMSWLAAVFRHSVLLNYPLQNYC